MQLPVLPFKEEGTSFSLLLPAGCKEVAVAGPEATISNRRAEAVC